MEPSDLTFHTVSTSLRPSRLAIQLDREDPDWMQSCLRIIEYTTQIWGGWYSFIVPTDGKRVSEQFWKLLEAFDPDYVYTHSKSLVDIKASRPGECNSWIQRQVEEFVSKHPGESDPEMTRQFIERDLGAI